jgi:glutathione synthase/RimK-type ligase-like ATP-grasp enzyme
MAKGHWQIIDYGKTGRIREGESDTVPIDDVPQPVLNTALKSANLIGDGLYGVDLKQVGQKVYVIEVNDNPNIDTGMEDFVLKGDLYFTVMQSFVNRIEQRKLSTLK